MDRDLISAISELQQLIAVDGSGSVDLDEEQLAKFGSALERVQQLLSWIAQFPGALSESQSLEVPAAKDTRKPHRKWTAREDSKLVNEHQQQVPISAMAKLHGRTKGAIRARLNLHGLLEPKTSRELDAFRRGFRKGKIPRQIWNHRCMLMAIFLAATKLPPSSALEEVESGIRQMDSRDGLHPTDRQALHKTYLVAWLCIIHERMQRRSTASFEEFLEAYPEVLDSRLVLNYYSENTLRTPEAKESYIPPDREELPSVVHQAVPSSLATTPNTA